MKVEIPTRSVTIEGVEDQELYIARELEAVIDAVIRKAFAGLMLSYHVQRLADPNEPERGTFITAWHVCPIGTDTPVGSLLLYYHATPGLEETEAKFSLSDGRIIAIMSKYAGLEILLDVQAAASIPAVIGTRDRYLAISYLALLGEAISGEIGNEAVLYEPGQWGDYVTSE